MWLNNFLFYWVFINILLGKIAIRKPWPQKIYGIWRRRWVCQWLLIVFLTKYDQMAFFVISRCEMWIHTLFHRFFYSLQITRRFNVPVTIWTRCSRGWPRSRRRCCSMMMWWTVFLWWKCLSRCPKWKTNTKICTKTSRRCSSCKRRCQPHYSSSCDQCDKHSKYSKRNWNFALNRCLHTRQIRRLLHRHVVKFI